MESLNKEATQQRYDWAVSLPGPQLWQDILGVMTAGRKENPTTLCLCHWCMPHYCPSVSPFYLLTFISWPTSDSNLVLSLLKNVCYIKFLNLQRLTISDNIAVRIGLNGRVAPKTRDGIFIGAVLTALAHAGYVMSGDSSMGAGN